MEIVHPEKSEHFMPYAPGIRRSGNRPTLHVSGATALPLYHAHPHVPEDLDPPEAIEDQTRLALQNIGQVLEAAGATFRDVVQSDIFLTNIDDQDKIGVVMREFYGDHIPVGTMVEVSRLVAPGLKIEINAIAEIPE